MGLEEIISSIFLLVILTMVLPGFFKSNSKIKQFFKNLFVWSVIVLSIVLVSYLIFK